MSGVDEVWDAFAADVEKAAPHLKPLAKVLSDYYHELLTHGMTREAALELTVHFQALLWMGREPEDKDGAQAAG